MKVGILTSFYPEIHGGAETSLAVLLDGLRRLDLDPIVLTLSRRRSQTDKNIIKIGHVGHVPKNLRLSGFPGLNSILARALSKSLRQLKIDVLHVNDTYSLRAATKAAESLKIPIVLSFHNNLNIPYTSYGVRFPVSSWLDLREKGVLEAARRCAFIMATSSYIAQRLMNAGVSTALVKPIYIGGAIRLAGAIPARSDHQEIRVLSVGKMHYYKGFQNLVIAAKNLRDNGTVPEVVFVGDGPYRNELLKLTAKLGVTDKVRLVGHVDQQELETLYDWCDTVVVPTITPEPFGRVAVEAMSRGRPVIGTDSGGLREIIGDGETGFLVPPGDSSAIAEKLDVFRHEPRLMTEMGERGLEKCKAMFNLTMIAGQVLDVYRSVGPNN